jgi:hypothetical protein
MRAALAWTTSTCLAAALALCGCSKRAQSPPPADTPSASVLASDAMSSPTFSDEASDQPPSEVATPTPTATPSAASSETPLIALAPPVGLEPGKGDIQPFPAPNAPSSLLPVAGGKSFLPGGSTQPPPAEIAFSPRDECAALPGWKTFRDRLGAAVASKNALALAALADRNVKLDYGGGGGRAELIRRLGQPAGLWRDLVTILPLGCSVEAGLAALPWYFWRIPANVDPADTMLVTGDAVPLRTLPKTSARVLASLDWPMVVLTGKSFNPAANHTRVRTRAGGQEGYVETRRLRSLLARRIIAEHKDGEWRITAIVAGD